MADLIQPRRKSPCIDLSTPAGNGERQGSLPGGLGPLLPRRESSHALYKWDFPQRTLPPLLCPLSRGLGSPERASHGKDSALLAPAPGKTRKPTSKKTGKIARRQLYCR